MGYVVAVLEDDTFEEPHVVIGVSEHQVVTILALYVAAAQPMTPLGRLTDLVIPDNPTYEWLYRELADVDDIRVDIYSTEDGSMKPAGEFVIWIADSREALEKQHRPPTVDVIKSL